MADEAEPPRQYRKKAAAEIFALDRRVWAYVCSLGFDAACAYLVLASGTGYDNCTSSWSATAVETRAGMSWYAANAAIGLLKAEGVLDEVARKGSWRRYKLSKAHEIPALGVVDLSLDNSERAVLAYLEVHGGKAALGKRAARALPQVHDPRKVGHSLRKKGLVSRVSEWEFKLEQPPAGTSEPEWNQIWLPNAIVVGAGEATSPIKRLRRAQNPLALQLFIDLYFHQYLPLYGGIEWTYPHGIRSTFKAWRVGEQGLFKVWGFTPAEEALSWMGSRLLARYGAGQGNAEVDTVFWEAFRTLVRLRLVEMVPHLIANEVSPETPHPDVIHPVPVENGTEEEREITIAAMMAAKAMVLRQQLEFAIQHGNVPIVPVSIDYERFQLIGIPRLAYRPQTDVTSNWLAKGTKRWAKKVRDFQVLEVAATTAPSSQALKKALTN